ncbi:MAG: dicarboxylate/amino acid:cation symporter [Ethanoligenens sp.]
MTAVREKKKTRKLFSLTTQILVATVGGIVFGSLVGPWAANLKVFGDIFIRLIQMSVVLLVMTSVSSAIGNVSNKGAGKMGLHTFKWTILLTLVSAFLGLGLATFIQPGSGIRIGGTVVAKTAAQMPTKWTDILLGFVPTNVLNAMSSGTMVPCILFAILFGVAMGSYARHSGKTIVNEVVEGFNAVIMNIIKIVMKIAPIGVFCLLANVSGAIGFKVVIPMSKFLLLLLIGDIIQFLVYGPLTGLICKINPLKMVRKYAKMSIMALTTTSSAICLPTKIEDSVTKFGVSRKVADFTGPITMAMCSNGAVQCYVAAILFMSQSTGIHLSAYQLVMAILLSCLMCMGTIVVPGGMVIVYTFLATSLGLPIESIAVLIGIDWFSGMFRTVMNVDVDVMVSMLVSNDLGELDRDVYNEKKTVEYAQA